MIGLSAKALAGAKTSVPNSSPKPNVNEGRWRRGEFEGDCIGLLQARSSALLEIRNPGTRQNPFNFR